MKTMGSYRKFTLSILLFFVCPLLGTSCDRPNRKQSQLEQLGRDAYTFGYPLVLMDLSRKYTAAIAKSSERGTKIPMYQFYHSRKVRDSRFQDLASLDNDMIYSTAWLDLSQDPVVLTIPESGKRFFVGGLLQGWSDIFGVIGTRSTGHKRQRFLLSGPQWKGKTPSGMKPLRSSTNLVWIPIRIDAFGGGSVSARSFQNGLRLTPLSRWGKKGGALRMVDIDPSIDLKKSPQDQVFDMSAEEYYTRLCHLMVDNPPLAMDAGFVEKLSRIGIIASKNFKFSNLSEESQRALTESVKGAKNYILTHQRSFSPAGHLVNGWTLPLSEDGFGTDYYRRAYRAYQGLGFLPPQDAVFPVAYEDSMGQQLVGENSYQITFAKNQLPPVHGFWSITLYQLPDVKVVDTPVRRYSLSQYSRFRYKPDGSLTIYVQPSSPGRDKEPNWIPSGKGNFQLTLKMYWPKKEVIEGRWNPPVVERIQQSRMALISE